MPTLKVRGLGRQMLPRGTFGRHVAEAYDPDHALLRARRCAAVVASERLFSNAKLSSLLQRMLKNGDLRNDLEQLRVGLCPHPNDPRAVPYLV